MNEVIQVQLIEMVISILSVAITSVILPLVAKLIISKLNNDRHKEIVEDVSDAVSRSVEFLEARMVKQLKTDGKWDSKAQREALDSAISMAIDELSNATIKNLKLTGSDLRTRIEKEIEKYIMEKKNQTGLAVLGTVETSALPETSEEKGEA